MTTKEYFEKRAIETELHSKNRGERYLKELKKSYEMTKEQIKRDIKNFYKKYANELSKIDNIMARQPLKSDEIIKYNEYVKNTVDTASLSDFDKEVMKNKYLADRLSRLESLLRQCEMNMSILTREYENTATDELIENYKNCYSETAHSFFNAPSVFDISFEKVDNNAIKSIVNTKWSNKSFSSRIWGHHRNTVRDIKGVLNVGISLGYSVDKMSKQISSRLDVNYSNAKRLIRTESNYVLSEATHDLYRDVELEQYQFLATLDLKTSEICQGLDNQIFFVKDRKVGLNCNPMHPNCRSTTVPYLPEYMDENDTRIARGIDGKGYKVPANMDYKAWYESMSDKKNNTNMYKSSKNWKKAKSNQLRQVEDLFEYNVNGVNYKVDGRRVVLDYNKEEKQIAEIIAKRYGKNVKMIPRVLYPKNIKTPDFLIDGIKYDLKTPTGSGKNTIYDIVKSSKNQSDNFILDLSKTKLSLEEVEVQINKIFESMHTNFVNEIAVFKDMKLIDVYYRK